MPSNIVSKTQHSIPQTLISTAIAMKQRPAIFGGIPTIPVDIPICAVFLVLFALGAISHMTLFRLNLRRNHKFIPSVVTFGFCMSRLAAHSVRIAWAIHPTNQGLAIASQILVAAGVVLLYILNLLFAQRLLRATHPKLGWLKLTSYLFKAIYVLIVLDIIMVIIVTIQSFYTSNPNTLRIDHAIQLYVGTCIAIISFLPLPLLAFILSFPKTLPRIESFGTGSWTLKVSILTFVSVVMCLSASFRAATSWAPSGPASDPPWYDHKACFYVFTFSLEILTVYTYLFGRVDRRFYVPDGSSKIRSYSCERTESEETAQKT